MDEVKRKEKEIEKAIKKAAKRAKMTPDEFLKKMVETLKELK